MGQGRRPRRAPFLEDAPGPGVAQHHPPGRHRLFAQLGLPVLAGGGRSISPTISSTTPSSRSSLLADVAVERHRIDAELLAELAHAQGLDAAPIGEIDGSPKHTLPGQGRAGFRAFTRSNCHLTSVRSSDTVYGVVYTVDTQHDEGGQPWTKRSRSPHPRCRAGSSGRSGFCTAPPTRSPAAGSACGRPPTSQWGMLRLKTVGRKTGKPRVAILGFIEDGPNLVTPAMNGWADPEPAWWLNLQAQPHATVELPTDRRAR